MIHEAGNQYEQAIAAYWTAVRLEVKVEEYSLALASLFFQIDNDNQAIEVLQAYLEVNPNSAACLGLLGTIQLMNSRYNQVLPVAKKALTLSPDYPYGYFLLGMGHKGLHQQEEARRAFEKTTSLDPAFADAYVELGLLYSNDQKTFRRAAENLRKAISLGISRKEVYKDLGAVLLKLGENEEAVQRLEQALKSAPEYVEAHYLLAAAYRKLGEEEKAAASIRKFQTLSREARNTVAAELKAEEHYTEGVDFFKQKEMEKAYSSFSAAVETLPNKHLAYYHLAVIDISRGDYQRAQNWIRRALELYPWKSEYHFVMALCLQSESPASATQAVRRAISLNPTEAEYYDLLGNLLLAQEDYQEAIRAYDSAIAVDPDHPSFHLNLSTALRKIGAFEKAEQEKNRYLELVSQRKQNR